MDCVLAYDFGGSFLKAGLFSLDGKILAEEHVDQEPPVTDHRGVSEKAPRQWWRDFVDITGRLFQQSGTEGCRIAGLAGSATTRTQIFIDRYGEVVRPAFTWADGRATDQARRVLEAMAALGTPSKTFGPVNAYHTLPRLLWVLENEPDLYHRIRWVLEPKDYINYRLCGEAAGDRISLSRMMTVSGGRWPGELMDRLGLSADMLPPAIDPQQVVGTVREGLPPPLDRLAGAAVFAGAMDAWCGALGIGAIRRGFAYNVSGTSEVFGVFTGTWREVEGLVTLPWGERLFQIGGPSQSGADCLAWFLEAFENEKKDSAPESILEELARFPRQPEPILFLPYLRGERTPIWEPDARGMFLGINRRHRRADFIWSILEGIAFSNRQVLALSGAHADGGIQEVRITGGAARSDIWCQIKADVLNLPVVRIMSKEAGLLGAAMVAVAGLGKQPDLEECQRQMVVVDRAFHPEKTRVDLYDRMFPRWMEAQNAMLPVSCALTKDMGKGLDAGRNHG